MKVTQEQFDHLSKKLEGMGYYINDKDRVDPDFDNFLVTSYNGDNKTFGVSHFSYEKQKELGRYVVEEYKTKLFGTQLNHNLFLALAAMTDGKNPIVGEYINHQGQIERVEEKKANPHYFKTSGTSHLCLHSCKRATKERLIEYFTQQNTNMKKYKVTRAQMKDIYNMACSGWQPKIEKLVKDYGDIFYDEVDLPEEEVEKMFRAATPEQLPTLKEIFPREKCDNIESMADTFCNGVTYSQYPKDSEGAMISATGNHPTNSFFLSHNFNWEIKGQTLIPTPKS